VRNKSTILVLHSGNYEIIGVRHRTTRTLYISRVIEPHSCTPAYGKLQVGIYIAAILDAMDRAKQDSEASEKRSDNAPAGESLEDQNGDANDRPPDKQPKRRNNRKSKRSKAAPQDKYGGKGKRHNGEQTFEPKVSFHFPNF
jgi:hypothetical protein